MQIKTILLIIIGLSGGTVIAAGVFAFITMIGVFPRLALRTNSAAYIYQYETAIIAGGIAGNVITVFQRELLQEKFLLVQTPLVGNVGLLFFGLFGGVYVGCLAMALAENLKVIPVLVQRVNLRQGMPWVIAALAAGKALGSFYQFYMGK